MKKYQDDLIRGGYAIIQIGNMDETAINWGIGPTHIYCGQDAERGEQEITDTKARITGIPLVIADGKLAPTMFIIKHSVSSAARADQTGMRVIPNLHKTVGFRQEDGWDMLTWERKMTVPGEIRAEECEEDEVEDEGKESTKSKRKNKCKSKRKEKKSKTQENTASTARDNVVEGDEPEDEQQTHKVRYLKHRDSGCIITSQYKAWNDTVRMAMYIDLILKPLADKQGGKFFLWMDNVSSHKVDLLDAIFKEANIEIGYFPPNMTQFLQVLDLIINGPLKAHVRRKRGENILQYFRHYKLLYYAEMDKPEDERTMPRWNPPKPTVQECILELINVMYDDEKSTFNQENFQQKVQSTFLTTGTLPREDGSFVKFKYKPSGGTTSVAPTGTDKKYSKSHYDADVPESEGNEHYSTVIDILDEWMCGESLDDFDPDVFDSDNNTMDDEIHSD